MKLDIIDLMISIYFRKNLMTSKNLANQSFANKRSHIVVKHEKFVLRHEKCLLRYGLFVEFRLCNDIW